MSLDSDTEKLLKSMPVGGEDSVIPPLDEYRAGVHEIFKQLGGKPDIKIKQTDRFVNDQILLRKYHGQIGVKRTGSILFMHGGGWSLSAVTDYDVFCQNLASRTQCDVYSVEYRLAPEYPYPNGLNDVCAAYEHLLSLGLSSITVIGDSAGGNLAAALTVKLHKEKKQAPAQLCLIYPVMDVSGRRQYPSRKKFGAGNYFLSERMINWTIDQYVQGSNTAGDPNISLNELQDVSYFPKTLIITAGYDPLVDEAAFFAEKLKNQDVSVTYKCFEGTIHGFLSFGGVLSAAKEGMDYIVEQLSY